MGATAERKIYFYRTRQITEDGASRTLPDFDPSQACTAIARLPFKSSGNRYLRFGDGDALAVWPSRAGKYQRIIFGGIRATNLPELEKEGDFQPFSVEQNQGLVEKTHAIFFDRDLVGAEFNFYGPRFPRLAYYFHEKCSNFKKVNFEPLLNSEAAARLDSLQDIRVLQVRLRKENIDAVGQAVPSLMGVLRSMEQSVDAPVVELAFRSRRAKKSRLGGAWDVIRSLSGLQNARQDLELFKVQGRDRDTGRCVWIDLLEDYLIAVKSIPKVRQRSRVIDSEAMFAAIEEAYEERIEELERAVSLSS